MACSFDYFVFVIFIAFHQSVCSKDVYTINILTKDYQKTTSGRIFDGIGGISGGGATSKLLINYNEPYRSQILDYLFKPNFGASLHMLKVEIGGDSQSTEGTESSHMHVSWEENYNRGYEWWLMKEAKKRNPDILLYGLPWAYPGWIGEGQNTPYVSYTRTATYILKWIQGAKYIHNLTIDFVGIWNEKEYNVDYVKTLRKTLDSNGFSNVKIIVGDSDWSPAVDAQKDAAFNSSLFGIGAHYPGTVSTPQAQSSGKPLWASEDYSTFNDDTGAGCWARILNQNYVNGLMTSTISWNIIASYYDNLPFKRCSLMTANEPWSGHYELPGPLWITAHTTQFTKPGWRYLPHGGGVGKLPKGGSYVSLLSPNSKDFTIIIESMSHDHSVCIRPPLPAYNVSTQNVIFQLGGILKSITRLHRWESRLSFSEGQDSIFFAQTDDVKIVNGTFELTLYPDSVITLSTVNTANRGNHPFPPPSQNFPVPYSDDFEDYDVAAEPFMLSPQIGSFEIFRLPVSSKVGGLSNQVVKQTVLERPVDWCSQTNVKPMAVMGNYNWKTVQASCSVMISSINGTKGVFLATRVDQGGCGVFAAKGIFVWLMNSTNQVIVSGDLQRKTIYGNFSFTITKDIMHTITINDKGSTVDVYVNNGLVTTISNISSSTPKNGYLGVGNEDFGIAYFDNLSIDSASVAGAADEMTLPRFNYLSPSALKFKSTHNHAKRYPMRKITNGL